MLLFFLLALNLNELVWSQEGACGTGPDVCDENTKIRSYDGSCNNKLNPKWGSALALYEKLLPPKYGDGK